MTTTPTPKERAMYERSYGYKYGEVEERTGERYASAADIAKMIREDIKQAITEGLLPGKPVTYSVTSESYSGGQSIDVRVKGWADAWQECDGTIPGTRRTWPDGSSTATICPNVWCSAHNDSPHASAHHVLTEEAQAAKMTLERIHGAYNHDGSEIQVDYFDVRYYGGVDFQSADSARWEADEKAKKAAKRAATDAAMAAGTRRVMVYGRGGNRTVHDAVEVDGRTRLVCGATLWRGSLVGDGAGRELTCSRCMKKLTA